MSKSKGKTKRNVSLIKVLPPLDTIHKFSDKNLDPEFIDKSLDILAKHQLKPLDPKSWHRPCWHSNYGYCLDDQEKTVFVKIFKPQLLENFQTESNARNFLEKFSELGLYVPKVLSSYQEDLCLVMEIVEGNSLSHYLNIKITREKLLLLLVSILANNHYATISKSDVSVNDWILAKSQQYIASLNSYRDTLDKFPMFKEISSKLSWLNEGLYSFALGDVTPTHCYWDECHMSLTLIDLELAGLKPEYYDLVYFCHRLLTRFPQLSSSSIYSIVMFLFEKFEELIKPNDVRAFRNNLISFLGVRMLGGLVDCLVIQDGTKVAEHLRAWQVYLKIRAAELESIK